MELKTLDEPARAVKRLGFSIVLPFFWLMLQYAPVFSLIRRLVSAEWGRGG
jgi:hypothetical protein